MAEGRFGSLYLTIRTQNLSICAVEEKENLQLKDNLVPKITKFSKVTAADLSLPGRAGCTLWPTVASEGSWLRCSVALSHQSILLVLAVVVKLAPVFFTVVLVFVTREEAKALLWLPTCLLHCSIYLSPKEMSILGASSLWGGFWLMKGCQNHRGALQLLGGGWLSSNFRSGQCGFADCQLDSVGPPDSYFVSWLCLSFGSGQILLPLDSLQNPRQWIKVQCENSWLSKMLILHVKLAGDPTRRSWRTSFLHHPPSAVGTNQQIWGVFVLKVVFLQASKGKGAQ